MDRYVDHASGLFDEKSEAKDGQGESATLRRFSADRKYGLGADGGCTAEESVSAGIEEKGEREKEGEMNFDETKNYQ